MVKPTLAAAPTERVPPQAGKRVANQQMGRPKLVDGRCGKVGPHVEGAAVEVDAGGGLAHAHRAAAGRGVALEPALSEAGVGGEVDRAARAIRCRWEQARRTRNTRYLRSRQKRGTEHTVQQLDLLHGQAEHIRRL